MNVPPLADPRRLPVVFVVLTCVLDELAMMLLLLPVLLPTILALDLYGLSVEDKAIWFGILMLVVVSVGLIAPPIGLDVYVVHKVAKTVPIGEIYRGIVPFLVSDVVRIVLLIAVSQYYALGGKNAEISWRLDRRTKTTKRGGTPCRLPAEIF